MKIIIEIDDKTYNYAKDYDRSNVLALNIVKRVMSAIANGEVLTKNTESEE